MLSSRSIKQKLSESPVASEEKSLTSAPSTQAGANVTKALSYVYHKRNEMLLGGGKTLPWPFKAMQHVLDFSGNFLEEEKTASTGRRFEKAAVSFLIDRAIPLSAGTQVGADFIGSFGEYMTQKAEKAIAALPPHKPGNMPDQKRVILEEGLAFYNLLSLPKSVISGIKEGVMWGYDRVVHPGTSHLASSHRELVTQIAPEAIVGLDRHQDYLRYRVQKLGQQPQVASDFMRTAAWKDELYRLQTECHLTDEHIRLLNFYVQSGQPSNPSQGRIEKPDAVQLKRSLDLLEAGIRRDLSRSPDESVIFQSVNQCVVEGTLIVRNQTASREFSTQQRMAETATKITALTDFGSAMAGLVCPKTAKLIQGMGNGLNSCITTVAAIATGNVWLGLSGLGGAISSFFGMFGGDDDELGEYLNALSENMREGFNTLLSQQVEIGRALSAQAASNLQQTLSRFDQVDYNIDIIQQQNRYLIQQNQHISQQVNHLSQQLNQTEIHIFLGLQALHADLQRMFVVLGEGVHRGFVQTNEHMAEGFNRLSEQTHLLNQEISIRMEQQTLHSRELFDVLSGEQKIQSEHLQQSLQQLQILQNRRFESEVKLNDNLRTQKEGVLTKHADLILGTSIDLDLVCKEKAYKEKIKLVLGATHNQELLGSRRASREETSEEILAHLGKSEKWQEINFNAFNYLNLLNPEASHPQNLIHFPTHYKNLLAFLKILSAEKLINSTDVLFLSQEVEKYRDLLRFCHELAKPDEFFGAIEKCEIEIGKLLEKYLTDFQKDFAHNCQKHFDNTLAEFKTHCLRFKQDEFKVELAQSLHARQNQILFLNLFGDNIRIDYEKPCAYYVIPENLLHPVLPLIADKIPPLPKIILELEALGVGLIHFNYIYDADSHAIKLKIKFKLSNEISYELYDLPIPVANGNAVGSSITQAWRNFNNINTPALILSQDQLNQLKEIHQQRILTIRFKFNQKLLQALSNSEFTAKTNNLEAQVGLLHATFKLIFESAYLNQKPIIHDIFKCFLTEKKLHDLLMNYRGQNEHPYEILKNSHNLYENYTRLIKEGLLNGNLYIENLTLTNALLIFDNVILELLPKEKRLDYLNTFIEKLPKPLQAASLVLRGDYLITQEKNIADGLKDYREACKLQPDDNFLRNKYADALFATNQCDEAGEEYSKILTRINNSLLQSDLPEDIKISLLINKANALTSRADVYFNKNFYGTAIIDYEMALQILPHQPELVFKMALANDLLGEVHQAIALYRENLALHADHFKSLHGLAECLVKANQKSAAFDLYQQLQLLNPQSRYYLLQCAELYPLTEDKKPCVAWLIKVANDNQASVDELLQCGGLLLKHKELMWTKKLYQNLPKTNLTLTQLTQCKNICEALGDFREAASLSIKILSAKRSLFVNVSNLPITHEPAVSSVLSSRHT